MRRLALCLTVGAAFALGGVGCDDNDGVFENIGEELDDAAEDIGDAAEELGDELEKATDRNNPGPDDE